MGRRCKENKLLLRWDKHEDDYIVYGPRSCDIGLLMNALCNQRQRIPIESLGKKASEAITWDPSLIEELENRGYDTTTIRFEIERKVND